MPAAARQGFNSLSALEERLEHERGDSPEQQSQHPFDEQNVRLDGRELDLKVFTGH
jgi:hypothetical protein